MEEQNRQITVIQSALKMGLFLGILSIIATLLFYLIDPTLFAKWWINMILLCIFIVAIIVVGKKYRETIGGFISFNKAFTHGFIIFLVSGFLSGFFTILLFQVIDPDLKTVVIDASIEQTMTIMEKLDVDEDQMEEALEQMDDSMQESFSTAGQIKSQGFAIIFYMILSLFTGLIVKKRKKISDIV